jgi:S1-C subfamily serine protease
MRTFTKLAIPVVMAALAAGSTFAGGEQCQKAADAKAMHAKAGKCTESAEQCAKEMAAARNNGWLGLEINKDEDQGTMTVAKVIVGSPAEKAGFRAGDVLVALNGVAYSEANMEKLSAMRKELGIGSSATYTVSRDGREQKLNATLGRMPDEVYTAWVKHHMEEDHAQVASN